MNNDKALSYKEAWAKIQPDLIALHKSMQGYVRECCSVEPTPETNNTPLQCGDDENTLGTDWQMGSNAGSLVSFETTLTDGQEREGCNGFGFKMELTRSDTQEVLDCFVPDNFTDALYTEDMGELRAKINEAYGYIESFADKAAQALKDATSPTSRPTL